MKKKIFVSFVFKFSLVDPWNYHTVIVTKGDGDIRTTKDLFAVSGFITEQLRQVLQAETGILTKQQPLVQILNWKVLEDDEEEVSVPEDTEEKLIIASE